MSNNAQNMCQGGLIAGVLTVGGGSALGKIAIYSPTLSPAQVAANTTAEQVFTGVTGLLTTDILLTVQKPTSQAGLGIVGYRCSADGSLAITFSNNTGTPITPTASQVYQVVTVRAG